jgi:hypothetical protein
MCHSELFVSSSKNYRILSLRDSSRVNIERITQNDTFLDATLSKMQEIITNIYSGKVIFHYFDFRRMNPVSLMYSE